MNTANTKGITLFIEKKLVNKRIILRCCYELLIYGTVDVKTKGDHYKIVLKYDTPMAKSKSQMISKKSMAQILEFTYRDIIQKETKNIRELLIARAFMHEDEIS